MIDELFVHNLALIEEAMLEPAPGLTVFTGETGAGKSALLNAIKLLMGERASIDLIRDGANELSVEGHFYFDDDGDEYPDGHIAKRSLSREGRSRASYDGHLASVNELSQLIGEHIDLCGQHEHQKLLKSVYHAELLDAWGREDIAQKRLAYQTLWNEFKKAEEELAYVREARSQDAAKIENARFIISRIEEVNPKHGEYEELEQSLPRLEHAEALLQAVTSAHNEISGDNGILDSLNEVLNSLEFVSRYDAELETCLDSLREALFPLEDVSTFLRRYENTLDFDQNAFEEADVRMGKLVGLTRMFGPRMEDVFETYESAKALIETFDSSDEREKACEEKLNKIQKQLREAAREWSQVRSAIAPQFARQVTEFMSELEMKGSELIVDLVDLEESRWSLLGPQHVEFLYRPGPGIHARPLAKIASGGESSRIMLAIKAALRDVDMVDTLIFDEIDAGVGGATARSVAAILKRLSQKRQVLVVTHLAQIAVCAQRHYVVQKNVTDTSTPQTEIKEVTSEERVCEIARMLSGNTDKPALDHARTLLEEASSM